MGCRNFLPQGARIVDYESTGRTGPDRLWRDADSLDEHNQSRFPNYSLPSGHDVRRSNRRHRVFAAAGGVLSLGWCRWRLRRHGWATTGLSWVV